MIDSTIIREDKFGFLEEVSTKTGTVTAKQKLKPKLEEKINSGKSIPVKDEPDFRCLRRKNGELISDFPYTQVLAEKILHYVMEGYSVKKISQFEGMPSAPTIYSWTRKYPDFSAEMRAARNARAEYCHDKIMELAESDFSKNDAQVVRTKLDAYKWLAGKNDPEEYGDAKRSDTENNVVFLIDTGVPRK